jgi:DNA-binding beta-propeller fold protein YncE
VKLKARIATIFEIAGNRQDGRGRAATPAVSRGAKGTGARRSRSLLALLATLFASVALLLGVVVPAADAATATDSYGYLASFGSGHYGTFQTQYNAVTVDGSTGNVLVGEDRTDFTPEGPGQRVLVYSPDPTAGGTLLTTLDVGPTNYYPNSVAVDQSDGALYLWSDFGSVHRFLSDGAPVPTYTEDLSYAPAGTPSGPPGGMAVDSVNHEVLAAGHEPQRVYRYGPTGALIGSFDGSNTAGGVFKEVVGLAVGPTGTVYVVDNTRVEEFNTAGASLGKLPISAGGAPSTVAVNPQSGEVAVAVARHGQNYLEGFTAAGVPTFSSRLPAQAGGGPAGLAWDAGTDRIYLNTTSGLVHTLIPAKQPGVDPPTISQVTPTSAHIEAKVAPGGEAGETTTARIEYCPATAPCGEYPVSNTGESNPWVRLTEHETLEATEDVPLGSGEKKIADDLTGLAPNTSYLVRASADRTSAGNVPTYNTSASVPLDTPLIPPDVQTNPAGAVTTSQALLSGTINTYGDQTTFHFEYGLTTNYGAGVPAGAEGVAGSERAPRTFTRTVTGLQPGTTYHYRLVAHNAAGTTAGIDRTFTTMGVDEVAPGRGYEQVTQVDKRGATLSPEGFQAAADGSAIAYRTASPSTDSEGAPLFPRYLSRRGASDWSDWQPLDPPANVWRGVVAHAVHAVSADFTHAMVVSNRALAPGAIENAANIYIVDLQTGAYSLVGSVKGIDPYLHFNGLEPANSYLAGAPDFSWIVLASADPLLEGVTAPALSSGPRKAASKWYRAFPDLNREACPAGACQW